MEWDTFYSTYSQSAAAFLGIIAAFVISKLLGLIEKVEKLNSEFENLAFDAQRIKGQLANKDFEFVIGYKVRTSDDIRRAILQNEFQQLKRSEVVEKILEMDKSLYRDDDCIIQAYKELEEKIKKESEQKGAAFNPTVFEMDKLMIVPDADYLIPNVEAFKRENDEIHNLTVDASIIVSKFRNLFSSKSSFDSETTSIKNLIYILIIAFPITVVYPLHFLPIGNDTTPNLTFDPIEIAKLFWSLKSLLLIVFFIIIEGLFFYFLAISRNTTASLDIGKKIEYTMLGKYHPCLIRFDEDEKRVVMNHIKEYRGVDQAKRLQDIINNPRRFNH